MTAKREVRVLVCGGRDYVDRGRVFSVLDKLGLPRGRTLLIEGGASGADRLARRWAQSRGVQTVTYDANWKFLGRSAGHVRNSAMLKHGRPTLVVAFPGGDGTADMVAKARAASVDVLEVDEVKA